MVDIQSQHLPIRRRLDNWLQSVVKLNPAFSVRRKHHRKSTPKFPAEIWALIVHHACLLYHDPLDTSAILSFIDYHPSSVQHETYNKAMKLKTTLALVSKQWNAFVRMGLYEFVWIARVTQAKALARTLLLEYIHDNNPGPKKRLSSGSYIRRLHIETPVLERCSLIDIRTILDFTPSLTMYADQQSLQRSMYSDTPDPRCSPEEFLKLIVHSKLRSLSWTTYGDIPFSVRMAPLTMQGFPSALNLKYLELTSISPNPRAAFSDSAMTATIRANSTTSLTSLTLDPTATTVQLPSLKCLKVSMDNDTFATLASWDMPALENVSVLSSDFGYTGPGFHAFFEAHGAKMVQLELGHSSSAVAGGEYWVTAPRYAAPPQGHPHHHQYHHQHHYHVNNQGLTGGAGAGMGAGTHASSQQPSSTAVSLATLCPNLRVFVCSADAEWDWQSPDWIAPHILLPSHPNVEVIGIRDIDTRLGEDPDPGLVDTGFASSRIAGGGHFNYQDQRRGGRQRRDVTPYFPLFEQLCSLLRRDAFPCLKVVRDMSLESHHLRATSLDSVSLSHLQSSSLTSPSSPSLLPASSPPLHHNQQNRHRSSTFPPTTTTLWPRSKARVARTASAQDAKQRRQQQYVVRFWSRVVETFHTRGVSCEDYSGKKLVVSPQDGCLENFSRSMV